MSHLCIKAGSKAYDLIRSKGLDVSDIYAVVSAAGGPKWFTTYGLVRYIISDLLKWHTQSISFIGASVGGWQMTAACTSDPGAALDRLRLSYAHQTYTQRPSTTEVSEACEVIIKSMLGDQYSEILDNPLRHLGIITSRGRGWLASNHRVKSSIGFMSTYLLNSVYRPWINLTCERTVIHTHDKILQTFTLDRLPTHFVPASKSNLLATLKASGSIPYVMNPVYDIPGARRGTYWDGGLTDYHMSFLHPQDGIVLHPHFMGEVLPGWMDKKGIRKRRASQAEMAQVLLIHPSPDFVRSLPKGQISDMQDFYDFEHDQEGRIKYWLEISERSMELGVELKELIRSGRIAECIELYRP